MIAWLAFFFIAPAFAFGPSADDVVAQFARDSRLIRSAKAARFCDRSLKAWPGPDYARDIRRLGELWTQKPEAAYFVIDTCQTLWMSRYFDPLRLQVVGQVAESTSYVGPVLNVLRSAGHLREEIYAFSLLRNTSEKVPAAPFEILTGLASTQRQLDEIVHHEMRENVKALASLGGSVAATISGTKNVTTFMRNRGAAIGRIYKYALIAAIVAGTADLALDQGLWQIRYADLHDQIETLRARLKVESQMRPVLLDEYFRAAKQLGYFLSFDVYLREAQMAPDSFVRPQECTKALSAYYQARAAGGIGRYVSSASCRDAAVFWLEAAEFLESELPMDPEAELLAGRLREKALMTYQSYEAAWAYLATLPVCRLSVERSIIFQPAYDCFDPKTGNHVL